MEKTQQELMDCMSKCNDSENLVMLEKEWQARPATQEQLIGLVYLMRSRGFRACFEE